MNDTIKSDAIQLSDSDSILAVVYVSFSVSRKGKIMDIGIEKVENVSCDEATLENLKNEALRVISAIPEMDSPKKGKKVKMILPIKFRSNDE